MANVDIKRLRRHLLTASHIKPTTKDEVALSIALVIMSTNDGFIPIHDIKSKRRK